MSPLSSIATECLSVKQDKSRLKCYDDREMAGIEQTKEKEALAYEQRQRDQRSAEFKKSAAVFVRDAQANLALSAIQWQNFMDAPRSRPLHDILADNENIKIGTESSFISLMNSAVTGDPIADKVKDYFSAWGLAFSSVRPTSGDSPRSLTGRSNREIDRMAALAARLKMDL